MWVGEMRQNRKAFGFDVVYVQTRAEYERLWGSDDTRRQTMELVSRIRSFPLSRRKRGAGPVVREQLSRDDIADYCSRIHAAIRHYRKRNLGVLARQVLVAGYGKPRKREIALRQAKAPTALNQLLNLQRALQIGSAYKFEKAYFSLLPAAWHYLAIGFEEAASHGKLHGFTKVDEPSGHLLLRPMLNADLLALILPHAIAAAPKRGRPSVSDRDRAVAELLRIFKELTGRRNSAAKCGGFDGPTGDGADFLRSLEQIFRIDLVPCGSTHAIDRAKSY